MSTEHKDLVQTQRAIVAQLQEETAKAPKDQALVAVLGKQVETLAILRRRDGAP